nr:DUF1553 domain-containing protein [Verrucomicrobiota bacterium]
DEHTPQVNPARSGRLELAHWIASPTNPLTARVMANRIWQHLFGVGLVETPDDFGRSGQPPADPVLLDHLAQRLIANGWSVKKLIREITLSRVYQLGTAHAAAAYEVDPANRLHWRMNRRRLQADAIRDAILFISGQLDLQRPPARIAPLVFDDRVKSFDTRGWLAAPAKHRTVYQPVLRDYIPADLSVFDFPDPELVTGRRDVTTVPTQALYLMNSPFIVEQSRHTAQRVAAVAPDDAAQIEAAYALILGRPPAAGERAAALSFLREFQSAAPPGKPDPYAACAAFCQTLFASAEFRYLY